MFEKAKLTQRNATKWYSNLLLFFIPLMIVYFTSVAGIIQAKNGAVSSQDFIPTAFTWGGISLYVINGTIDYLKKLKDSLRN